MFPPTWPSSHHHGFEVGRTVPLRPPENESFGPALPYAKSENSGETVSFAFPPVSPKLTVVG